MPKYPKTLYVRWDGDEPNQYLKAAATPVEHAEIGEDRIVAVYQLLRTTKIHTTIEIDD